MDRRARILAAVLSVGIGVSNNIDAQEVTASVHVPPAEVYVLGDDIPLVWRFTNQSADPLAMLWEGCCRLNGKLVITANGQPVEILPPGASSFHTYSKAETLPPGKPMEFRSLLADWVRLPAGGELEIGGHYTGVLANQKPQVTAGLALWTGTASATKAKVTLLNVDDYLAQRATRSRERGLAITLSGPDRLPPLDPATFTVTLRNVRDAPQVVDWPGTFQLWLVDERGRRLEKGAKHLSLAGEQLTIPANGELKREFPLSSADLSGEPIGVLKVFLDLGPAGTNEKRVPSNPVAVTWRLGELEAAQLLHDAADGPAVGSRNPALKLMRQYLGALRSSLSALTDDRLESEPARGLRDELLLAACVQPLSSKAGPVFVPLIARPDQQWVVAIPGDDCPMLSEVGGPAQVGRIASIRRHLGWDVTPEIVPQIVTTVGEALALARELSAYQAQLAGPLTWRVPQTDGAATNLVQFPVTFPGVNAVVRFARMDGRLMVNAAQKPVVAGRPAWMNQLTTTEATSLVGTSLPDVIALQAWLQTAPAALQPLIIADETLAFHDLRPWLQPIADASLRMSVLSPAALP